MRSKRISNGYCHKRYPLLDKPNILLLTIDTLRPDRVGVYGRSPSITPNIDRLAARGVRFTQAITGGSWTQAAFPVLLTSTYASMHGGCLGLLSKSRPSPVSAFKFGGYHTAAFSTSPLLSKKYGYDLGFDEFTDLNPGEKDPLLRKIKGGQRLLKQPAVHYISRLMGFQSRPAKIYSSAQVLTDNVIDWIDTHEPPFFVWAHFMDVHWPYHLENSLNHPDQIAQAWQDVDHLHKANWNGEVITREQKDHYIDLYERAVAFTDDQVGRLLNFLSDAKLAEETIIVLLSDHGEEFLEHGRWGHWEDNLHDEVLIVPLIMHVPGIREEGVIEEQVSLLDVMPTLLELGGISAPKGLLGASLTPLWDGRRELNLPETAVCEMWRDQWHIIAVRTEKEKLIWDSKNPESPLWFDLRVDPGETNNIYDQVDAEGETLSDQVKLVLHRMKATKPEAAVLEPELDDDLKARLRDLGYIE